MTTRAVMSIVCPRCAASFEDRLRDFADAVLHEGPLLIGCTGCGLLFRADLDASSAAAPAFAPTPPAASARYRLEHVLGRGGFGETWRAVDRETGDAVCVKRLHPGVPVESLQQEWRALMALHHPNIVRPVAFHADEALLVTAFVDGEPLGDRLARGPLPPHEALHLGAALADALTQAHREGVLHRDLKPANIVLRAGAAPPEPVVLDFGLGVVRDVDPFGAVTAEGNPGGTPAYMPPEQFEGRRLTPACDVYAWALVMAEALTGAPADARSVAVDTYGRRRAAAEGLDLDAVPARWRGLLRACTRAAPEARPSMVEVALALGRLGEDVPPPTIIAPHNLTFAAGMHGPRPLSWSDGVGAVHGASRAFRCWLHDAPDGRVMALAGPEGTEAGDFGVAAQSVPAEGLRGCTLRWSGQVSTDLAADAWAALWVRVDDAAGRPLAFDNMAGRGPRGRTDWARIDLAAAVGEAAETVWVGALVVGAGTAWFGDLRFEVA